MVRIRRRQTRPEPQRPSLRPTAILTLLATLLAIAAALVGQRYGQESVRLVEARGRLALMLSAQTEVRLDDLRRSFATVAGSLEPAAVPDAAALAALLTRLRDKDPAFLRLELGDAAAGTVSAGVQGVSGGLVPGPDGAGELLFSWPLQGGTSFLLAHADVRALPSHTEAPQGLMALFVTSGGALIPATAGAETTATATGSTARELRALAADAHRAAATAQRELAVRDGGRLLAVAAPLRDEGLTLVVLVPGPRDRNAKTISMPVILLALAGTALAMLPLVRKKKRRP